MNPIRREFLRFAAGALLATPVMARPARANAYPTRPVRIIVGFAPGAGVDHVARLFAQLLTEKLGQPFVVENRPGAATNVATDIVVRSAPDGHTLLWLGAPSAISAAVYSNLKFDFGRDIAPVARIMHVPYVLVVNPSLPAKTIPELIAYAKSAPTKINMGSSGNGATTHVLGELFKMMAGIDMVHVPYRGLEPAHIDLMGERIHVVFTSLPSGIGYIKSGQLRALGVTTATRSPVLPDVPAIGEFVTGYDADGWQGIGAPRGTPPEIIAILNRSINEAINDPKVQARLTDMGGFPAPSSVTEFNQFVAEEVIKWAKVVKYSGARSE
jgi:tripartite-type tricarboxylate transporter receptor subunit TctC